MVGGTASVDQSGVYTGGAGSLIPGARVNAVTWTDVSGNFWMFGGYGFDGTGKLGFLNDLWEYTGGNWVWKSGGATNVIDQLGVYGAPGTTGTPGGRREAIGWTDTTNGNLWLFGGEGEDSVGTANGILNDLWVYSIANNQWTFVVGSAVANQTGIYASQTVVGPVSTTGAASTCGLSVGLVSGSNILCSPVSIRIFQARAGVPMLGSIREEVSGSLVVTLPRPTATELSTIFGSTLPIRRPPSPALGLGSRALTPAVLTESTAMSCAAIKPTISGLLAVAATPPPGSTKTVSSGCSVVKVTIPPARLATAT